MSSGIRGREGPGLFDDLPLQQETRRPKTPAVAEGPKAKPAPIAPLEPAPQSLPLFSDEVEDLTIDTTTRPAWRPAVPFVAHLTAGLVDFVAMLGVVLAIGFGLWWLDVDMDPVGWALVLVFLVPFSLLYQVFPLAFWGRTPGMAKVGLVARNQDGQTLSFSQAAFRWLASVLTVASAGLPWVLIATTGRSLADRLSDSQTLPAR